MAEKKISKGMRFTPALSARMEEWSARLGVPQTSIVELGVRAWLDNKELELARQQLETTQLESRIENKALPTSSPTLPCAACDHGAGTLPAWWEPEAEDIRVCVACDARGRREGAEG